MVIADLDPVCLFVSFLFLSWSADCRSIMFDVYLYCVQAKSLKID